MAFLAHAIVPGHDGNHLRRLAEQFGGCQMHRVERPNRFRGEGPTNAIEYCSLHIENEAASSKGSEATDRRLLLLCRQPTHRARTDDRATRFCQRQGGGHLLRSWRQPLQNRRVMLEECSNEGRCAFISRCPAATAPCSTAPPPVLTRTKGSGRMVACHEAVMSGPSIAAPTHGVVVCEETL